MADALAWPIAVLLTAWAREDFTLGAVAAVHAGQLGAAACAAHLAVGAVLGPYRVAHSFGSWDEVVELGRTVVGVGVGMTVWVLFTPSSITPRGVPALATAVVIVIVLGARLTKRLVTTRKANHRTNARRAIVFGAGDAGRHLLRSLVIDQSIDVVPVAVLDDDKTKQRLHIEGVRVRGTRADLASVAAELGADLLIVAVPSATGRTLRELADLADGASLEILSLPSLSELMGRAPTGHDVDSLDLGDFLGRRPVVLDEPAIGRELTGKIVLVTGAGGSIGAEMCRQVARFHPAKLYLLDRDESGLHGTHLSLNGDGLLDSDTLILANIREAAAVHRVFDRVRPDIVFHAAALKHLPLLETHPLEAWHTNVIGTLNVLEAAAKVDVRTFVNISTDKAANPTSVLGYSKRVAERLTADYAQTTGERYVSVRFGNVLGSRGSVLHSFVTQIDRGGPVTVTDPEVQRFFMLIPEASQLVLQAATMGQSGEVMVLEMGEQIRILDVAKRLIRDRAKGPVDIVFTGLRHGEKLKEELFGDDEVPRPTSHEMVHQVNVKPLAAAESQLSRFASDAEALEWMREEATEGIERHDQ
jgi:FlaA1/EpsC-like NDP-sugar epimerase